MSTDNVEAGTLQPFSRDCHLGQPLAEQRFVVRLLRPHTEGYRQTQEKGQQTMTDIHSALFFAKLGPFFSPCKVCMRRKSKKTAHCVENE